jgi:hypothetical protein
LLAGKTDALIDSNNLLPGSKTRVFKWLSLVFGLLIVLGGWSVFSQPKAISVLYAGQKPVLELTLSERAQLALDNGVSLQILSRLAAFHSTIGFSFRTSPQQTKFVLQRHALSNRYLVKSGENITPRLFASVEDAMNYIASTAMIQLESFRHKHAQTAIRVHLNKFDLPSPMRLDAFLTNGWKNDTGWTVWEFAPHQKNAGLTEG